MSEQKYRYFSPAEKCVVTRYGTDSLIGATRTPDGYVINPEVVVAIPVAEVRSYAKEYRNDLANKSLVERKESDYTAFLASRRAKTKTVEQPAAPENPAPEAK